ncbi:MAG: hypothetical protein VX044_01955 [Planctomycetota bacterium]|nr:hypothetical protein [Planctomycetota bacterium]
MSSGLGLVGQDAARDTLSQPRTIVIQNLAPFAPGVALEAPGLNVEDRQTVWQPFGARWPDGSWRQALCLFRVEIPALSEQRLTLLAGTKLPGPRRIEMPPGELEVVVRRGDQVTRAKLARVRDLESNRFRRVELRRARVGDSGIVAELVITAWRDQPWADVSVAAFFSDPDSTDMERHVDELAVECLGAGLVLRHSGQLGIAQRTTPRGSRAVLLAGQKLGDGQGLRRVGVLVPPLTGDDVVDQTLQAATVAPLLAATSWRDTGAFGPFGVVPEPPSWLRGDRLRVHFARRHREFVRRSTGVGDPFGVFPHGLARFAGQTGDQPDFGVCKLSQVAWSGVPSMLLEVELSAVQEACRPVHFFERDAAPVDPEQHPDWVVWSGRTHWHGGVSKDRLGKPSPAPRCETHGWTGKDRQHWSSNYLSAYALLTGAHWARRELENEARLFLAGQTLDPRLSTSTSGAPRGAGRTMLAAAWNLCVSGDERLRERMDARTDQVHLPKWPHQEVSADRVRPLAVNRADDRLLRGAHPFWNPWQDAIAAVGFAAQHRMTGNANARVLAEALAQNVLRHGWLVDERGSAVAMAMRWQDGDPLTAAQWRSRDETLVQWSFGSSFSEWSIGAVEIARVAATRDGDTVLRDKAAEVQRRIRASRRPPPVRYPHMSGIDRLGEWDAVRWTPK